MKKGIAMDSGYCDAFGILDVRIRRQFCIAELFDRLKLVRFV